MSEKTSSKTSGKTRVKDDHEGHNHFYSSLDGSVQSFLDEVYLLDGGKFKGIRLTSGKRGGNEDSQHFHGNAVDIAAWNQGGELGNELYSRLVNTQDGLALMDKYGLGIYDETNPENLKKTGGSGPHFHIGKDTDLYNNTKQRLGLYNSGSEGIIELTSFYSKNPDYDYDSTSSSSTSIEEYTGLETPGNVNIVNIDPNLAKSFVQGIKKERKKEEVTDKKVTESESRKKVEAAKKQQMKIEMTKKKNFMDALHNLTAQEAPRPQKQQKPFREQKFDMIDMQTSLPTLPSIHRLPDFNNFKDGGTKEKRHVKPNGDVVIIRTTTDGKGGFTRERIIERDGKVIKRRALYGEGSIGSAPKPEPHFEDGGISIVEGVDPTDPPKKSKKQITQETDFTILNKIRGTYKHLDPETEERINEKALDFGGDKPVKGARSIGYMPMTTEDYVTWTTEGGSFKPDPTSFIDVGISGVNRGDYDTDDDYNTAVSNDRVVLASKPGPNGGLVYFPVGTGETSQKIAEGFSKRNADFQVLDRKLSRKQDLIPYYTLRQENKGSSAAYKKKFEAKQQAYYDWRQAKLKTEEGLFNTGSVEQQRYGGLFRR